MIVIATSTRYNSLADPRFPMAVKFVENAVFASIPVAIVDDSPDDNVSAYLKAIGAIVIRAQNPTMGTGRRMAIKKALQLCQGNNIIVWSEPEKYPLIKDICKIIEPIIHKKTDIVIPRRKDNLASYPEMQMHAELYGNRGFQLLTGYAYDMWFGPRVFDTKTAAYFLSYDGKSSDGTKDYGDRWDSIFIPVLRAIKVGLRITEVTIDYQQPQEQTAGEDNYEFYEKRLLQLNTLLEAIKYEARLLGLPR